MSEQPAGKFASLWAATSASTSYAALNADLEVDVAVIGGGIAGLTAALALKRAGQTVAVLEAARVGTGVTGNTTGKVTSLHRLAYTELAGRHGAEAARIYGQANEAAIQHVAGTVTEEGIDCGFRRVSNYTYAESEATLDLVREEAALAARLGLPASFTTEVPLPFAVKGAVRFGDQAQIHALRYVQGLARAVDGDGSFVFEESPATGFRDGTPAVADTERGSVRAREIIVATNMPIEDRGIFAERCYLHRSYIVAARSDLPPLDSTFLSLDEPMRSILTIELDGTSYVLTGGEGHPASERSDSAERYRRLSSFARDRLGADEIVYRWSTQDAMPADGLPYVGPMSPDSRHIHVITGLRKWGLTNGTAAALILRDTLCGRSNPWAAVFDSTRGVRDGRAAQADGEPTDGELAGGEPTDSEPTDGEQTESGQPPASPEAPAVPLVIAPGEGQVVDVDGAKTAVYLSPAGNLSAVSAVCTHLGCTVEFNPADVTWDCPCHGSRFSTDGTVVQGPAARNLASSPAPPLS
ncbi:FAD-dependent oxidoreductase [Arthrobacter oryzae]|uniref:FAD-dependent oxidoreductase n=1 Tax=Arthrobacter oryzae TaxID=409290 RepID=UPI0027804D4C|nr:FAD-dependent oxidoreductase [Arthrobacter oryzae]MDQ0076552.1 glycine/D-amino acid oxidase-like deaminating enzyme/Rieske Fe-S protein [Arthrobacter oryzae]